MPDKLTDVVPDDYRLGGNVPVSTETFISPKAFEEEREKIFKRVWLNVGRAEDIPKAGDFFVRELEFASVSAIVVRGNDGRIRALHNACSHRGAAVVLDHAGSRRVFKCPYHGWVYGLDGRLTHVYGKETCFSQFDETDNGLSPISCDVWEGFVFVNLAVEPETTLNEFLDQLTVDFKDFPFERYGNYMRTTALVDVNWRLAYQGNLEMYHFMPLHGVSAALQMLKPENPTQSFVQERFCGPHTVMAAPINPDYVPEPNRKVHLYVQALQMKAVMDDLSSDEPALGNHPVQNPTGAQAFGPIVFAAFPDFVVMAMPFGSYVTEIFRPITHNTYAWEIRTHFRKPKTFSERFAQEVIACLGREVIKEDMRLLESQQRALESGAKTVMYYGDTENILRRHDAMVDYYTQRNNPASRAAE